MALQQQVLLEKSLLAFYRVLILLSLAMDALNSFESHLKIFLFSKHDKCTQCLHAHLFPHT